MSISNDFLSDNTVLLISTSLILVGFSFLWKAFLIMPFVPNYNASCSIFTLWKEKKSNFFILLFGRMVISLIFHIFCFFSSYIWYLFLPCSLFFSEKPLYLPLALYLNISLWFFYNILLFYFVSHLCFFDNKFLHSLFIYNKKHL